VSDEEPFASAAVRSLAEMIYTEISDIVAF
jgi:hypothetical protein